MKNLLIIIALFCVGYTAKAQDKVIEKDEIQISFSDKKNAATVYIHQDRYIFDGTAISACTENQTNNILVEEDNRLVFKKDGTTYIFNDVLILKGVSGNLLDYFKCWENKDPVSTVEIH